jgi:hypothetical protein
MNAYHEFAVPLEVRVVGSPQHIRHGVSVAENKCSILLRDLSRLIVRQDSAHIIHCHCDAFHRRRSCDSLRFQIAPQPARPSPRQRPALLQETILPDVDLCQLRSDLFVIESEKHSLKD